MTQRESIKQSHPQKIRHGTLAELECWVVSTFGQAYEHETSLGVFAMSAPWSTILTEPMKNEIERCFLERRLSLWRK